MPGGSATGEFAFDTSTVNGKQSAGKSGKPKPGKSQAPLQSEERKAA